MNERLPTLAGRYEKLDSLRGLAAVTVVFHHALITTPSLWGAYDAVPSASMSGFSRMLAFSPIHILWGGYEAVLLFFILSGFVLSLSFWEGKEKPYIEFFARRFLRIYPTAVVVVFVAALMGVAVGPMAPSWVSTWFPTDFGTLSIGQILDEAIFWPISGDCTLVRPMWSLVHEMRISIIFPIIIWFMRRYGRFGVLLALMSSVVASVVEGTVQNAYIASYLDTVKYMWLFFLGAEVARSRFYISQFFKKFSWIMISIIAALSLAAMHARWLLPASKLNTIFSGFGAAGLISILATTNCAEWLYRQEFRFLGKISYSLYLVHYPLLCAAVFIISFDVPIGPIAVAIGASLPLAWICYELVERRFMWWRLRNPLSPIQAD